ncbi:hypothetical protein C8F01DRAFT_1353697 [Mycena amicta]|nr:hypothetical protein C8F01DRAFT_1353697 [Mycena amicta]
MLLSQGSQRTFTKVINLIQSTEIRKSTFVNLERTRETVKEIWNFNPTNEQIWNSHRAAHIPRRVRNFIWKCMHNSYYTGEIWLKMTNLEHFAECAHCKAVENLDHIMLECNNQYTKQIWMLSEELWRMRYRVWPRLNWGLLLDYRNRFFAILVSNSMYLIWKLRNEHRFEQKIHSHSEIHNRWVATMNAALKRDILLTNKIRFGQLAFNKESVLNTWSGILWNEESLPDDWTRTKGVLVGIRPISERNGVG